MAYEKLTETDKLVNKVLRMKKGKPDKYFDTLMEVLNSHKQTIILMGNSFRKRIEKLEKWRDTHNAEGEED